MALVGVGLIIVGFSFKLALVPFHLWTPDVYQGAPAPVTAFVATVSKGAMFALLVRYFSVVDLRSHHALVIVFTLLAIASMVVGNLLALLQHNVKRLLAYSSIAHLGYLLVAFLASSVLATTAVTFYLVAYFVTTLGAFGVVTVLSTGEREAESLDDYRGLVVRRPWLAALFTAMLLSLAGIPLTAGFVGKFYLTVAARQRRVVATAGGDDGGERSGTLLLPSRHRGDVLGAVHGSDRWHGGGASAARRGRDTRRARDAAGVVRALSWTADRAHPLGRDRRDVRRRLSGRSRRPRRHLVEYSDGDRN